MKKKLVIGLVAGLSVAGLAGLGAQLNSSGLASGRVQGCNELASAMINPMMAPSCSVVDGVLLLTVTTPIGVLTYDVATGLLAE